MLTTPEAPIRKIKKRSVGNQFVLADNSKVKFNPNRKNTFGLNFGLPENGGTCPGATLGPGGCLNVRNGLKRPTCYMAKVTQIYKKVVGTLQYNSDLVVGKSYDEMLKVLTNTFDTFKNDNKREDWFFRITYSGDIFSKDFAKAVRDACKLFPEIQFWLYTRSFDCVEVLSEAQNLAVYLSVDPVNSVKGYEVYEGLKHRKNIGLAWMGTPPSTSSYKFVSCPETSGKIENTKERGACSKCRLCFKYNEKIALRHIQFNIH